MPVLLQRTGPDHGCHGYPQRCCASTAGARARAAAQELAAEFSDPALFHHSLRTYTWARWLGTHAGVAADDDLLFVAAMLHDLALNEAFDTVRTPFEVASGNVAVAFAYGAGWDARRRRRLAEVIHLHMRDHVTAAQDPEAHLLQLGVQADVSGIGVESLPRRLIERTLRAHPRAGFEERFLGALSDQASRKPGCAAAADLAGGVAARVRGNPLGR